MGGNALKNTFTKRYNQKEFESLAQELIPIISDTFKTKANLVKSFTEKESFGDMDVLLLNLQKNPENSRIIRNMREVIQKTFNPNEIVHNGSCWSFDYKNLQIDLILVPYADWITSNVFYAYNDLGNLMGKMYHKFNLKYGFDGLKYVYRKNDRKLDTFTISKDPRKIFDFLCLDYDRFLKGFDTIQDVFDYVIGSNFFDSTAFKFENLNAINKRRNKRRVNYNAFIEYCEETNKTFDYNPNKDTYLPIIDAFFPEANLRSKMIKAEREFERKKRLKEHFNGKMIMQEFPELRGQKLGSCIENFKNKIEKKLPFEEYLEKQISTNNSPVIMKDFRNFYQNEF